MAKQVTFGKEQRETAIAKQLPLVALCVDGRHLKGTKEGAICYTGPMSVRNAERVKRLMLSIIRERSKNPTGA